LYDLIFTPVQQYSFLGTMPTSYLVIVTGASRGFGKSFCLEFTKQIFGLQEFVLIGRVQSDLDIAASEINQCRGSKGGLTCQTIVGDFEIDESIQYVLSKFLEFDLRKYTRIVFVNNAFSIHPLGPVGSTNLLAISQSIQVNVTSPILLMSSFLNQVKSSCTEAHVSIVNVSSLWALEPTPTVSIYCATKAAIEMFIKVASLENCDNSRIKFLNYAPGPLNTDMQQTLRENLETIHPSIQDMVTNLHSSGTLVDPRVSALKCVRVVVEDLYASGDHLDYYDPVAGIELPRLAPTTCCANPDCQCGVGCECGPDKGVQCGGCLSYVQSKKK
jgi:sepiapterin reductase